MREKRFKRVLLSNDDGVNAPGISLLEKIAEEFAEEVWVVAPAVDRSGVSNSLSLREPVRVEQYGARKFAVHGTPADCVSWAVKSLMADNPPDLLLSGINCGSNIGFETTLSGTVGAATTGILLGIPSIALSQDKPQESCVNWQCAEAWAPEVIRKLIGLPLQTEYCFNVNFPNLAPDSVKGMKLTSQGVGTVKGLDVTTTKDPLGADYFWIRVQHGQLDVPPGSEVEAINAGFISVTPLTFERTYRNALPFEF